MSQKNPNASTGPRTEEGKAASSQNSLKHGLSVGKIIIAGEDPEQFLALVQDLENDFLPATTIEAALVHDLAKYRWLTDRAIRLQQNVFTDDGNIDEKRLALFIRYQSTNHRAFQSTLKSLQTAQKERRQFVSQQNENSDDPNDDIMIFGTYADPIIPGVLYFDPEKGYHYPDPKADQSA